MSAGHSRTRSTPHSFRMPVTLVAASVLPSGANANDGMARWWPISVATRAPPSASQNATPPRASPVASSLPDGDRAMTLTGASWVPSKRRLFVAGMVQFLFLMPGFGVVEGLNGVFRRGKNVHPQRRVLPELHLVARVQLHRMRGADRLIVD